MKVLSDHNTDVAGALSVAEKAIDDRHAIYENPDTGLRSRFQQVKAAVGSQFGRRSPRYKTVSLIKY